MTDNLHEAINVLSLMGGCLLASIIVVCLVLETLGFWDSDRAKAADAARKRRARESLQQWRRAEWEAKNAPDEQLYPLVHCLTCHGTFPANDLRARGEGVYNATCMICGPDKAVTPQGQCPRALCRQQHPWGGT